MLCKLCFFSEFNPIERCWAQVKRYVADRNGRFKMADVKELAEQGIKSVTPENWQKYINKAIRDENKFAEHDGLDVICKLNIKPVIIENLDSSDSDWLTDTDNDDTVHPPSSLSSPLSKIEQTALTVESETSTTPIYDIPVVFESPAESPSLQNTIPGPSNAVNDQTDVETVCQMCSKDFKKAINFQRHSMTFEKCNMCERIFCGQRTKFRLQSHQKSCKGIKLGYVCDVCNKKFKYKCRYAVHITKCGKMISCDTCDSKFKHKNALIHHLCPNMKI